MGNRIRPIESPTIYSSRAYALRQTTACSTGIAPRAGMSVLRKLFHGSRESLHFYTRANVGEFLGDGRGFVLAQALFYGLGSAVHQILGFLQTQAGDFANRLDDVDLVGAGRRQNHGEFGLLFNHRAAAAAPPPAIAGAAAAAETPSF